MEALSQAPALHYWVYAVVALFIKMLFNSVVQGYFRLKTHTYTKPEDAKVFGGGVTPAAQDNPVAETATRVWRNDLENIPIFLFLALGFVLLGGPAKYAAIYFGVFTAARYGHALFFFYPQQPHRNLCYQAGTIVCVCLAVHSLRILSRFFELPA